MTTARKPVIAFISATPAAIQPAVAALEQGFPDAEAWNILDDRLLQDAVDAGGITPALQRRMTRHIFQAVDAGADGVLLTCSMYSSVASSVSATVPVLGPDEAAFDDAVLGGFRRIIVLASIPSALKDTTQRLAEAVAMAQRDVAIRGILADAAFDAANAGDHAALTAALAAACDGAVTAGDGVLLAQYSLSPAQESLAAALGVPVIAGPRSAVTSLREAILGTRDTAPTGVLGAIADDFTGGTDLALSFRQAGLRTLLLFGVPPNGTDLPPHDALVVALKSRTAPVDEAVRDSLAAWRWLSRHGAQQLYFKYCSTFDSTAEGNIGPVLDALSEAVGASAVITTPSSPQHRRTVYQGQLFVDGILLSESHMAHHPLTPMTDSDLPRLLRAQTSHGVELLTLEAVRRGVHAVRAHLTGSPDPAAGRVRARPETAERTGQGRPPAAASYPKARYLIADGIDDDDLAILARAVADQPLSAGAAGLGGALAADRAARRRAELVEDPPSLATDAAPAAILAGSCSRRTLEQIADFSRRGHPAFHVDPATGFDAAALAEQALAWVDTLSAGATPLLYTSVSPAELEAVHAAVGADIAAGVSEDALSRIAQGLVRRGVRRLVCAGGETSGAILNALDVWGATLGTAAAPGVPWIHTLGDDPLALLLKSGNFGDVALFSTVADDGQGVSP